MQSQMSVIDITLTSTGISLIWLVVLVITQRRLSIMIEVFLLIGIFTFIYLIG